MTDDHRPRRAGACAAFALGVVVVTAPVEAAERPSNERLVLVGLGLALPVYLLDVALHEGAHAVVARAFGAEILEMRVLPSKHEGHWYFGLTRWQGPMERHQLAWVLAAPSLVHGTVLTAYSLLVGLDGLPANPYGQLALAVLATGSWVDFSKDVFAFSAGNDIIKLHALYGRTRERQRFPYRVVNAALSAAAGYFLVRGYRGLFFPAARSTPGDAVAVTLPVYAAPF